MSMFVFITFVNITSKTHDDALLFSKQINDSYKQYACFYILSSVSVSRTYLLVLLATSARRSCLHNSFD